MGVRGWVIAKVPSGMLGLPYECWAFETQTQTLFWGLRPYLKALTHFQTFLPSPFTLLSFFFETLASHRSLLSF